MSSIAQKPGFVKSLVAWISAHELAILGLLAPFFLFPNRYTPAAALLLLLVWLCRWAATGRLSGPTLSDGAMLLLLLSAAVGCVVSVDAAMSRAKWWGIVLQVAAFYGVVNGLQTEKGILRVAGLLVLGTTGVALAGLAGADWDSVRLLDLPQVYDRLPRLIRGLPGSGVPVASDLFHVREVGASLAMLLPIPFALLLFGRDRRLRTLSTLALALGGGTLLLCQSLQALMGLGMALLLIAVWRSRWFLLALPLGLLGLAGAVLTYGPSRAALALLSLENPFGIAVVLRLDIWSRALAMVRDMPFTGAGLNTFPLIQTHFYPGLLLGPEPHAHSLFLGTAVDLGLPGLVALLWLLVVFYVTLVAGYRLSTNRDVQVLLVGLAAGVLAYVGHGLVDSVTLGAKPVAALFIMLGLAPAVWATSRQRAEEQPAQRGFVRWALRPGGGATGLRLALPAALSLALLLAIALLAPATLSLNLGAIPAHKALVEARTEGWVRAQELAAGLSRLQQAAARAPDNVYLHDLLGSLYAWQADDAAALRALQSRVTLESPNPLARYGPHEALRRRIEGEAGHDRWDDALRVYQHWLERYPGRAESYVRPAAVWHLHKGDAPRAAALLRSGLEAGARPAGLLSYYLAQIEAGE